MHKNKLIKVLAGVGCAVIVVCVGYIIYCHIKVTKPVPSAVSVSTEDGESINYSSSFAGDTDENVSPDGSPVYDAEYNIDLNDGFDAAEYYSTEVEYYADRFESPNYSISEGLDMDSNDVNFDTMGDDVDWYYIEEGTPVTIDGVIADNIPTGTYRAKNSIKGAKLATEAPVADLNEYLSGIYIGGTQIPAGTYHMNVGYCSAASVYPCLLKAGNSITCCYLPGLPGTFTDEQFTVTIYDGVAYNCNGCKLERVGD